MISFLKKGTHNLIKVTHNNALKIDSVTRHVLTWR